MRPRAAGDEKVLDGCGEYVIRHNLKWERHNFRISQGWSVKPYSMGESTKDGAESDYLEISVLSRNVRCLRQRGDPFNSHCSYSMFEIFSPPHPLTMLKPFPRQNAPNPPLDPYSVAFCFLYSIIGVKDQQKATTPSFFSTGTHITNYFSLPF